jgi:hypothetical protein
MAIVDLYDAHDNVFGTACLTRGQALDVANALVDLIDCAESSRRSQGRTLQ